MEGKEGFHIGRGLVICLFALKPLSWPSLLLYLVLRGLLLPHRLSQAPLPPLLPKLSQQETLEGFKGGRGEK